MNNSIHQAIFMTNTFAESNPQEHVKLWGEFEKEVPYAKRSGYFGADNVAYINYLRKIKAPAFITFFNQDVEGRG